MQQITLPHTDLNVSRLCFGCWGITTDFHWGDRDETDSVRTIHAALDAGVNFFDTAAVYADGNSERLLGRALGQRRREVVVATKIRPDMMKPADVATACEQSLERLGTDYLDLFQTHWTDPDTPPADTWQAMIRLKEQGKVRHIGVCNMGVGDLTDVCAVEKPVTNQLPYNLLWRMLEAEVLPMCEREQIGVLAYSPLMHGLLSGKFTSAADVPDGRARSRHFNTDRELARHGEAGCEQETFAAIAAIGEIAASLDRTMADVALAWCAAQPAVSCVIAGARTPEQLVGNVQSLDNPLPAEVIGQLNAATDALAVALGSNPDMWQGSGKSRFR